MNQKLLPLTKGDNAWKEVLDAYFPEFMNFFYPQLATAINWSVGYETLDKELQAITTQGMIGERFIDKLLKVQLTQGKEHWLLIHIEVQAAPQEEFSRRLFEYYYRLYDRYNQPTITLAVLTDDKLQWRPSHFRKEVLGIEVLNFHFLTVKLLDYRKQEAMLLNTTNPFGLIILAHLAALDTRKNPDNRFASKFSLTKQLYERGLQRDDILTLYKFIDWIMVLPEPLEIRYNECIHQLEEERSVSYITSAERIGMQKGFEQGMVVGRQEGEYLLLLRILKHKFQQLPESYVQRLAQADAETLLVWGERVLEAESLEDIFGN